MPRRARYGATAATASKPNPGVSWRRYVARGGEAEREPGATEPGETEPDGAGSDTTQDDHRPRQDLDRVACLGQPCLLVLGQGRAADEQPAGVDFDGPMLAPLLPRQREG